MLPGWVTWSCGAVTIINDSQCCRGTVRVCKRDGDGAWLSLECFVSLPQIPAVLGVRAAWVLLKCCWSLFWGGFQQK